MNKIIIFFKVVCVFFLIQCKKKTEIVTKDDTNTKIAYDYWSNYKFEKRVYKVFKKSSSQLIYLYNDTLFYTKDSNIATAYKYYFQQFKFSNSKKSFLIGIFNESNLRIRLGKADFTLFNLDLLKEGGPYSQISYNGFPFENRYEVKYISRFLFNYPTNFGKLKVISSNIRYVTNTGGGSESSLMDLTCAKNYGLVEMQYNYSSQNVSYQKDTIFEEVYQLDKIIK